MLTNLKLKLIKSIKSKRLQVFGLFFLLATFLLIITKFSKQYREVISFNIELKGVPNDLILTKTNSKNLQLEVKSYGINLLPYFFQKKTIEIDFDNDLNKFGDSYYWIAKNSMNTIESQLGKSITLESLKPDTLKFNFQQLESKKVPVILNAKTSFAVGFDMLKEFEISPDSIVIIGSKDYLDTINLVKTKPIILKDLQKEVNKDVALETYKGDNNLKFSQTKVNITGKVEKFTEGTVNVPVTIINLPEDVNINYFPKTVSVSYNVSLDNYKNIKPNNFKVVCDYSVVDNRLKTFLTPKLTLKPDLVKSTRIKQNRIEYIIIE